MKRYLTASLLVLFTLALAAAGFLLPDYLTQRQQDALIGRVQTFRLSAADSDSTVLTESDASIPPETLFSIGESYLLTDNWRFYEPIEGQLYMEEALTAAKTEIAKLVQLHVLPDIMKNWNTRKTSAEHGGITKDGGDRTLVRPEYGCWIIYYGDADSDIQMELYVNSISGQILKLYASWPTDASDFDLNPPVILQNYLEYLGLQDTDYTVYTSKDTTSLQILDYGGAAMSIFTSRSDDSDFISLTLSS